MGRILSNKNQRNLLNTWDNKRKISRNTLELRLIRYAPIFQIRSETAIAELPRGMGIRCACFGRKRRTDFVYNAHC